MTDTTNGSKKRTDANSIKPVVTQLVGVLNSRNKDVISRRFGLKTGKRETLESIGQSYGITRERVRQIEEASIKLIRDNIESDNKAKIKPYIDLSKDVLVKSGGVLREDALFAAFSGNPKDTATNASLVFVLTLDKTLKRTLEDDNFYTFWGLSDQHVQNFKQSVSAFISSLDSKNEVIAQTTAVDFTKKSGVKEANAQMLATFMAVSKHIDQNVFGEIGLSRWPEIMPRGVRDKSFLVLKKEGKPKHFREITQLINQAKFSDKKAHVQTVHNELIKDNRFVLVGRGIYGLAEWGYKAGTVKDIMVDLLKSSAKPMTKKDIIAHVMSHRMVKENTIILNLQDSKTFSKTQDGAYTLKQA